MIKKERIINSWGGLVERGAGNGPRIYEETEKNLQSLSMPDVTWRREKVNTRRWMRVERDFLIVNHARLREYIIFLNVRDFGMNLDCAWFVTCQPGILKRSLSRAAAGHPDALSQNLDLFNKLDLEAWIGSVHHAFLEPIKTLKGELDQDISTLNTQSKGYLSIW
jgi:hypothetical protein